mgnify:CR=1 FL=1
MLHLPREREYRSNPVAVQGPAIDPGDAEQPRYILEVSSSGGVETRLLRRDGVEVQRTEVTRDGQLATSRVYEDGRLQSETVRSDRGLVLTESLYSNNELTERSEFTYVADRLVFRSVSGSGEVVLFTERYSYWGDGTLRSIVKQESTAVRTEYRYRNGRLEEEWVSRPGEAERFEFDSAGRLVIRELFSDGELAEQRRPVPGGVAATDQEDWRWGYYAAECLALAMAPASTFPPLRMIPTRPDPSMAPDNSAASPKTPDGSTTNFIR